MGVRQTKLLLSSLLLFQVSLLAAPRLRLSTTAVGPVSVAQGGTATIPTVEATNVGDGALSLQVSSSATWLTPAVGPARACVFRTGNCLPINFTAQTAALARGLHTAVVTVRDPNAVDAPQTITVTVAVGSTLPDRIELYARPGQPAPTTSIVSRVPVNVSTQTGGQWLSLAADAAGSFQFGTRYIVTADHRSLGEGNYSGTLTGDRAIPVTLRVTNQPFARLPERVTLRLAANAAAQNIPVSVGGGTGALAITGATAANSPAWLRLSQDAG
jgi:hypothetical protein